jgi:formylglycine-generating enzyme required for sulfatase activity
MQLLQEQYAALQQQHKDAVNTHQLDNEDLARQLSEMQARVAADRENRSALEQDAASGQAAQQDIQQLQDELNKAGERILALESDVIKSDEAGSELLSSVETRLQEQLDLVEHLREEMAAAGQLTAGFQDEARTFAAEHDATRAEFQEKLLQQTALSEKLQAELDGLKQEITETSGKLGEQSGHATALEEENADLLKQLEALKAEAATGKQELETVLTAEKQQQSELQQQLADLQAVLEQQQRALSDASTENETASGAAQSLEQDNEKLRTELRETARLLDEQKECVANQLAAMQAGEEALQKQQAGWGAERTALQQEVAQEQQLSEELRQELDQIKAQTEESRADLEKEQQALLDKAREQIERLEVENAGHRNAKSSHDEQLELAAMEREQLQQTLNAVNEEKSTLESEIESLKEQASSLAAGSEEALQLLQGQLDTERSRLAGLEQDGGDKDSQIRDLQQEILQSGESRNALKQELEALRQQHEDSRSQFEQQADRIKELEQEHNASIQKAHEDLTRKNDNEKELQGQINRLRKKLEQTSADQKSTRDGSQADLDNIREELHAERKARAEERAEMAARQRELKEQLMAIALEHEANLSNRSGAIEQARDAGREEEQERLRNLIEAQSQSEEQMFTLQRELQKAHEELAELGRQEKDRRQVDMDMMQEQNQQAVSTITQLEFQLKQLTLDRDAALEEQRVIREKMNALRGEVEVARGLMNASSQGQVEDPEKLRHELSESKKNMAIALRLRAEAEAARDQLIEERNKLRQELGEEATQSAPVQVRALDAGKAGSGRSSRLPKAAMVSIPENKAKPEGGEKAARQPALAGVGRGGSQRRWLGAVIGLGVVSAVALAAWLFIGVENPLSGVVDVQDVADVKYHNSNEEKPLAPARPVVATSKPVKPVSPPAEVLEPVAVIAPPLPVVTEVVAEAPAKEVVPEPRSKQASATRSFQDSLKDGLKGPVMVELPAGEYLMGSPGNSLNFDEGPRHNVTLPVFSISKDEVTFADYDKFARSTGRRMPYDESWGRGDRPVINVSWNDAQAYTSWLSKKTGKHYRLPTEAEWEYAARAGSDEKAWWDSNADVKQANCFNCGNEWAGQRTVPAGTFKANGFGLNDMAGNVQEWTEDCYRAGYAGAPVDGSAWLTPECTQRSVRGGSYTNPLDSLRNGKRSQYDQDTRLDNLGFRVVRSN